MTEPLLTLILNEVREIKSELKEVKEDVRVLKEDVVSLHNEQKSIKVAIIELSQAVSRIEENQKVQAQIIELLSVRSIAHEAALRQHKLIS
jgi:hypothetical protein